MEVPCPVPLLAPWSPLGYRVVEVADKKVPATGTPPPAGRPRKRKKAEPLYRLVEVEDTSPPTPEPVTGPSLEDWESWVVEESAPQTPTPQMDRPPRKRRRLVYWLAASSLLLAGMAASMAYYHPARARTVATLASPLTVPAADGMGMTPVPGCAVRDSSKADRPEERETFGTTVAFVRNPAEAERLATAERKLAFLLHVSGNFEESGFT